MAILAAREYLKTTMAQTCANTIPSRPRILPRNSRVMVKKADLLHSKTQKPLQLRNTALLSLDGGGLRGILTGTGLDLCKARCYVQVF